MDKEIKLKKKRKKGVLGRSMGRKEVLRGKGRGEKVGGNRKTGCREATGVERGEGRRDEKCLARKTRTEEDQMRSQFKYILNYFKTVPLR